jgi:hypothetical protein
MTETKRQLTEHVQNFEQLILQFFNRKTETQGINEMLGNQIQYGRDIQTASMDDILAEYPDFGAFALFGHLEFDESCAKVRSLTTGSSASLFEEIRAAGSVKVSDKVRPIWEHIKKNPEVAGAVIGICFLGNKRAKVRAILNKIKQHQQQ